jgi:hypothetical protein
MVHFSLQYRAVQDISVLRVVFPGQYRLKLQRVLLCNTTLRALKPTVAAAAPIFFWFPFTYPPTSVKRGFRCARFRGTKMGSAKFILPGRWKNPPHATKSIPEPCARRQVLVARFSTHCGTALCGACAAHHRALHTEFQHTTPRSTAQNALHFRRTALKLPIVRLCISLHKACSTLCSVRQVWM